MILNLYGPLEGRRHDCALLRYSNLLQRLENLQQKDRDGLQYVTYGDPPYSIRHNLQSPYSGAFLTPDQREYNRAMSSVRECVECAFGKIFQQWAFLDFRKNLKVLLQPVAKLYLVGTLIINSHTGIYGSETGTYFEMEAPTLEHYLR